MFNLCRETEGRHYSFIQIVKAEYKKLTIYLVTELVSIAFDFQWKHGINNDQKLHINHQWHGNKNPYIHKKLKYGLFDINQYTISETCKRRSYINQP
jgi:hypothetical protein